MAKIFQSFSSRRKGLDEEAQLDKAVEQAEQAHDAEEYGEQDQLQDIEVVPSPRPSVLSSFSAAATQNEQSLALISRTNNDALADLDITATLRKSEKLFDSIMDPNSEETKTLIRDLFETPMKAITDKVVAAVHSIDLNDCEKAKNQIQIARDVLALASDVRESCIESVYETLGKQIAQFEDGVDAWNRKVKETVVQTLELYKEKIEREIEIRNLMMEQRKAEHQMMLDEKSAEVRQLAEGMKIKAEAKAEKAERELEVQKKRDAHQAEKDEKSLEKAAKKAQQELEKEMKKAEANHERMKKESERAHQTAMNELERRETKGKIESGERAKIMEEFKGEMDRYQKEYNLADHAMRTAISEGGSCSIKHTAPKINWGPPPSIIPGSISWQMRG